MFGKMLIYASIIGIIFVAGKWFFDSQSYGETLMFTKDKKPVVTVIKDELFNTETKKTEWKPGFWMGLFPSDTSLSINIFLGVVPLMGIFLVLMAYSRFFLLNKKVIPDVVSDEVPEESLE